MCSAQINSLKRKRDNGATPVAAMYVDSPTYKRIRESGTTATVKAKATQEKGTVKVKAKEKWKVPDTKVQDTKVKAKEKAKEKVKVKEKERRLWQLEWERGMVE